MTRHISTRHLAKTLIKALVLTLPFIISVPVSYAYATNNIIQTSILLILLLGATIIRKKQHTVSASQQTHTISRLEDIFIFSGLSLNPLIPKPLGLFALASIVLLPHIAQQAQSLKVDNTKNTPPKEILPRTSILLLLALATFAAAYTKDILSYALAIIAAATIYLSAKSLQDTIKRKKYQA